VFKVINKYLLPITTSCKLLNVSTSVFYSWSKRFKNNFEDNLRIHIRTIAEEYPKYGYRRVYHQLKRNGIICNKKRILKIMKEENLLVKQKKKGPVTTQSNHGFKKPGNLIKNLEVYTINQVFVSDITYIRLEKEFVYLALIMDL
jgi:transposase InsO family protein